MRKEIPTQKGTYLWIDKTGWISKKNTVHTVEVCNVGGSWLGDDWLRVYWQGGYWNVTPDEFNDEGCCWPKEGWV